MTLKVEFNHPEMEKGLTVDLGGFLVENGGSAEMTEEQELSFVARHQSSVKDKLGASKFVKITGSSSISSKEMESMFGEPDFGKTSEAPTTEEVEGSDD